MRPVSEPWLSDSGVKTAWLTDSPQKQTANRVIFPLTLTDHFAFSVLHRRQRRNDEAADRVRRQRQCRGFGKMDAVTCSRNLRPFAPRQIFDQQVRLSRWPRTAMFRPNCSLRMWSGALIFTNLTVCFLHPLP